MMKKTGGRKSRWTVPLRDRTQKGYSHRRRMKREAKAKVVASVWGEEFIKFLVALAILPQSTWGV